MKEAELDFGFEEEDKKNVPADCTQNGTTFSNSSELTIQNSTPDSKNCQQKQLTDEKWYTSKEIAELYGVTSRTFTEFVVQQIHPEFDSQIKIRAKKLGGNQYSSLVIEKFKTWLLKNQANMGSGAPLIKDMSNKIIDKDSDVKWYSTKEICALCNVSSITTFSNFLKYSEMTYPTGWICQNNKKTGYHNSVNQYSEEVLKNFQVWLLKNQTSQGSASETVKENAREQVEIGMLMKLTTTSGDVQAAQELCNLIMHNTYETKLAQEREQQLKEQQPKVEYYDRCLDSSNLIEIGKLGKDSGIGEKKIFSILKGDNVIRQKYVGGVSYYETYRYYERYFQSVMVPFEFPDGSKVERPKLMLTAEGFVYFMKKYRAA